MILTFTLNFISVAIIIGMVLILCLFFKRSKPTSFLISLLFLLFFLFNTIRETIMYKGDWEFFMSSLLFFINIISFLTLIVFTIYILSFSIINIIKKRVEYRYLLLTILNIILCYILLFTNFSGHFHESNYMMQKRTDVVQRLLKNSDIKKATVGKYETYNRFLNYKLPKKDRWLSEYGEVSIKNNYIEFYYSQGTEVTTTDSFVYSLDGNKPKPSVFVGLEEMRRISDHWYYVSYNRY